MKLENRKLALSGALVAILVSCAGGKNEPSPAAPPVFGGQGALVADEKPLPPETQGARAAGPCGSASPKSDTSLLDDFEDGDHKLFKGFEREGWWYSASDNTSGSSIYPQGDLKADLLGEPEGTKENRFAAHFKAQGQTGWGVTWGTTLRWTNNGVRCPLNASAFSGIRFRAKGPGTIKVNLGIPETLPEDGGGVCKEGCYDNYHKLFILSDRWEEYSVRWDRLQQGGWGEQARFDPSRLLALNFAVDPKGLPIDFWIDDIEFLPASAPAAAR